MSRTDVSRTTCTTGRANAGRGLRSDRCAIIEKGKLIAVGTARELREKAGLQPEATLEDVFLKLTGRERRSAAELFEGGPPGT